MIHPKEKIKKWLGCPLSKNIAGAKVVRQVLILDHDDVHFISKKTHVISMKKIEKYLLLSRYSYFFLAEACWALSYISGAGNDRIQLVIDAGLIPRLIELLSSDETDIVTLALRCIGIIVTGTDSQVSASYFFNSTTTCEHLKGHSNYHLMPPRPQSLETLH